MTGERASCIRRDPRTVARCFSLTLLFVSTALVQSLMGAAQERQEGAPAVSRPTTPGAALLASIPPEASKQLFEQGWTLIDTPGIEDEHFDGVEALVLFERPKSHVLRFLSQTERQKEYRTDLRSIETIEHYDDGPLDEHRMRIMFVKMVYRIRYRIDFDTGRMSWELAQDFENSFRVLEGFWEFYELDEKRTLARFGTVLEVGPALPAFLQDMVTRSKLPASIENCRKWVNSDGTYRP